jgi:hypothetical protein
MLNIAWAGAYSAAIQVFVNDPNRSGSAFRDFYPDVPSGANSLIRQGIHDKYGINHISIPVSRFVTGTNTITLVQRRATTATSSYVMYDYLNLELPTAETPSGLSAIAGDAQVALNWAASTGAVSYKVKRSLIEDGPYLIIASPTVPNYADATAGNGTNYFYVISAVNANGESADSDPASARPTSMESPQIVVSRSGDQLQFTWPTDHLGWRLEAQTNSLATGLGSSWVTILESAETNRVFVPINPLNEAVFFRLTHP